MEPRHEMTAHIRKNRTIFFQVGLLTGLLVVFGAFKWTIYGENQLAFYNIPDEEVDSAIIINIIDDEPQDEPRENEKLEPPTPFDPDHFKVVNDSTATDTGSKQILFATLGDGKEIKRFDGGEGDGPQKFDDGLGSPIDIPEVMPSYPGGEVEMRKFISKNFVTPYIVKENATSSVSVVVKFVVEKDGRLSHFTVVKNGGYPEAGENLIKVLEKMPLWNPGFMGYRPVRVNMYVPLKIKMD